MGIRGIRKNQHDDVGLPQQFLLVDIACSVLGLDVRRDALACVIEDVHVEATDALCDGLSDPAKPENAESGTVHIVTERLLEVDPLEFTGTQIAFAFAHSTTGGDHQTDRIVGNAVVEHSGRVGHHHATTRACVNVDIVVSDGGIAYRF